MKDYDILLIDPPMKHFNEGAFRYGTLSLASENVNSKVFNPGLLSIGSYLLSKNFSVKLVHILHEKDIKAQLKKIKQWGTPKMIGISCSYMHTYLPSLYIAEECRKMFNDAIIVSGGAHIGNIPAAALNLCSSIDIIVEGEGELAEEKLIHCIKYDKTEINQIGNMCFRKSLIEKFPALDLKKFKNVIRDEFISYNEVQSYIETDIFMSKYKEPLIDINKLPYIKYDLYENHLSYPAYVEESRGCYGKCRYCVASIQNTYRYKDSQRFLDELDYAIKVYGENNLFPFTSATFGVNAENTIKICKGIIERHPNLKWTSEFRLDLPWEKYIDIMYKSGCRGFAIGLESASPRILEMMNKTTNPELYLNKAKALINKLSEFPDAIIHLNLMVYYGEDSISTIDNLKFITTHFNSISSVHYSPLILFAGTNAWHDFMDMHEKYGATIVKNEIYDILCSYPINPSWLFTCDDAGYFSKVIEKLFIEKDGYMKYHETRLARNEQGAISSSSKTAFIKSLI